MATEISRDLDEIAEKWSSTTKRKLEIEETVTPQTTEDGEKTENTMTAATTTANTAGAPNVGDVTTTSSSTSSSLSNVALSIESSSPSNASLPRDTSSRGGTYANQRHPSLSGLSGTASGSVGSDLTA